MKTYIHCFKEFLWTFRIFWKSRWVVVDWQYGCCYNNNNKFCIGLMHCNNIHYSLTALHLTVIVLTAIVLIVTALIVTMTNLSRPLPTLQEHSEEMLRKHSKNYLDSSNVTWKHLKKKLLLPLNHSGGYKKKICLEQVYILIF